jgi:thiol-disulfide isomerase/thioredoxin
MRLSIPKCVRSSASIVLAVVLLSCFLAFGVSPVEAFKKVTGDRGEMLIGEITKKELYKECPLFKENADAYVPDRAAVAAIKRIKDRIDIVMFLGTWCGDSQRESPKLLKLLDAAGNSKISLTMLGVDTAKDEGKGLSRKYNIERVPTILFMKNGKELGRIIENPKDTMETDFLAIVGAK